MLALQKDLEKISDVRELAAKAGLLRPFLYIVALPPVARLQIAINLGWTFVGSTVMGDAHAEAWEILSRRDLGLRDRMARMRDTLFRREVNWYSILMPPCEELCVPAYMNWSEEFNAPQVPGRPPAPPAPPLPLGPAACGSRRGRPPRARRRRRAPRLLAPSRFSLFARSRVRRRFRGTRQPAAAPTPQRQARPRAPTHPPGRAGGTGTWRCGRRCGRATPR